MLDDSFIDYCASFVSDFDVKDWGVKGGFGKIGEGDVSWADVRAALKQINYKGWATAEVAGGNREVCAEILAQMKKHLLGQGA